MRELVISKTNPIGNPDCVIIENSEDVDFLDGLQREDLINLSQGGKWVTLYDHIGGFKQYLNGRYMGSAV